MHSASYCKDLKRISYTVKLANGSYYQVETFVVCDVGCGTNCYAIGRYLRAAQFRFCGSKMNLKLSHINPVAKIPSALVAVAASDIVEKCIFVSVAAHDVFAISYMYMIVVHDFMTAFYTLTDCFKKCGLFSLCNTGSFHVEIFVVLNTCER